MKFINSFFSKETFEIVINLSIKILIILILEIRQDRQKNFSIITIFWVSFFYNQFIGVNL